VQRDAWPVLAVEHQVHSLFAAGGRQVEVERAPLVGLLHARRVARQIEQLVRHQIAAVAGAGVQRDARRAAPVVRRVEKVLVLIVPAVIANGKRLTPDVQSRVAHSR
jgi:hypothetical protein